MTITITETPWWGNYTLPCISGWKGSLKESTYSPPLFQDMRVPFDKSTYKNGEISFLWILWAQIERTVKWGLWLEYLVSKLNPEMVPLLENRGARVLCPLKLPCYRLLCVMGYHMGEFNFISTINTEIKCKSEGNYKKDSKRLLSFLSFAFSSLLGFHW